MKPVKCVVCGDGASGKTCLLVSYTTKTNFEPEDYIPTVFDNDAVHILVDSQQVTLGLWDTSGQEGYDRLRPLTYASASVILLCFSIDSLASFENIKSKWLPEIQQHAPGVPFLLVGTKLDLRGEDKSTPVTSQMGEALKVKLGAYKYIECSTRTQMGVERVFEEAVRCALVNTPDTGEKKKKCLIM